jgi:hypothetical protein
MSETEFEEKIFGCYEAFTSDGELIELVPGGSEIPVRFEDRLNYLRCLEKFKIREFDLQVEAIRNGIETIVSMEIFHLFAGREFEYYICGVQVAFSYCLPFANG